MAKFADLKDLIRAKTPCIWIKSDQELEVIDKLKSYFVQNRISIMNFKIWSFFSGLADDRITSKEKLKYDKSFSNIEKLFGSINDNQRDKEQEQCVYILKDFHLMNDNKLIIRALKDIVLKDAAVKKEENYCPIIVISPLVSIPLEHEKLFTVINFDTATEQEINQIVDLFVSKMKSSAQKKGKQLEVSEKEIEKCKYLAKGLTKTEIINLLSLSGCKYANINSEIFLEARENLINKTGLLTLMNPNLSIDDMGGNEVFKEWVNEVKITNSKEAQEYGVERSKGYLSIGVPGTSKTLSAEMISSELNLPLLKFNISKVMSSLVGKSEQNMEKALDVVKACAPCILLIDEIEKTLSGMQSSGRTDGGTMARVIGGLLQFLSSEDSKDVFTVMTSNDVSQMPPELTRSGRLDTIWYFGLPSLEERKEIWKIHFGKQSVEVSDEIIDYAANISENLTGAEIKEAVKVAMRKSFIRFMESKQKEITTNDIDSALEDVIPVYKSYKEKIKSLEVYAKNRARFASKVEEETQKTFSIDALKNN